MSASPDRLRLTTRGLDDAAAARTDATRKRSHVEFGLRDIEVELAHMKRGLGALHLANALGDAPDAAAPDAADIVNREASAEAMRQVLPQAIADEAEHDRRFELASKARNQAASRYAAEIAYPPAEADYHSALEDIRVALVKWMGADIAVRFHYSETGHADELGGQAARLIRHLLAFNWRAHAPALQPKWLHLAANGPAMMPGVAEARDAVIGEVEEAAR